MENTETAARGTTAMQSEVTSALAGGKGEDGSVKSLKRQKVDEVKAVTPKVSPLKKPAVEKKAATPKKPAVVAKKVSPAKNQVGNKRE